MAVNDGFRIPRKTQKVTAVTPTTILQYSELIGNLPGRKKFSDRVPRVDAPEIIGQAFKSTGTKVKAIGLYLQVDFRPQGQRRSGSVLLKFYSWAGYPVFPPVAVNYPISGRPAEVEIDIENINNLNETIFEFEEYIPLVIGNTYFFTIVQPEGWAQNRPIYVASSALNYGPVQGDFWIWNIAIPAKSRRTTPITDFVFDAYVSITELTVELVGTGGGNLTDIQDALTISQALTTPQAGFGLVDYNKPFETHGQCLVDPSNVYGDAPVTTGAHGGFSAVADLNVPLKTVMAATFGGGGLNDLTPGGALTSIKDLIFTVTIASTAPDTFNWTAKDIKGNVIASASGVAMVGGAMALTSGVDITWGALVGHTVGDYWTFYAACWDFAIVRVATDRIRLDWGDLSDVLDCSTVFRLMEEGDAIIVPEYVSQFSFRKHNVADADPTISITLWRTERP